MEKQHSVKTNLIMNMILTVSNMIFPLLTYSYVARILGSEGMGKITFVQGILAYFSYISNLGIVGYGTRECAKVKDDKIKLSKVAQEILTINLISTFIAYIALLISVISVQKFRNYTSLFCIMSISFILQTLGMEWLYTALEEFTYITIRSIVFKVVSVVLIFLLVKKPSDVVIYGGLTVFTTSASNILNFINIRKYVSFQKKLDFRELKRHITPILVFFSTIIITGIYGNFDTTMLGFIKNDAAVGIYGSALKIKLLVSSLAMSITSVLMPRMSLYYEKREFEMFNELVTKSMQLIFVIVFPISLFVMFNANDVIMFVCGKAFISAKSTLIILMGCVCVLAFTNLFGNQILIPTGNEKRYSLSVTIGMFINLILNLILIPKFSSVGAAVATLVTECFNMIWMGLGCKQEIIYMKKNTRFSLYFFPLLMCSIVELFFCYLLKDVHILIRLGINSMVMFGTYYVLLYILKDQNVRGAVNYLKLFIIKRGNRN